MHKHQSSLRNLVAGRSTIQNIVDGFFRVVARDGTLLLIGLFNMMLQIRSAMRDLDVCEQYAVLGQHLLVLPLGEAMIFITLYCVM